MQLEIKKIRQRVTQVLGDELSKEGYKLDSSMTWFTKKEGKNKLKIFLNILDYRPDKVEFRLIFEIWIHQIVLETANFHLYLQEPFSKEWPTFSFSEGDFHDETKHLDHKHRSAFTHVISRDSDVDTEILLCKQLLMETILPSLRVFMNLDDFVNYIEKNFEMIGQSTITKPAIIGLKLKNRVLLDQLVDHLLEKAKFKSLGPNDIFKKYVDNILEYSKVKIH